MSQSPEPLQTDEVIKALTERRECTLVHIATGDEVHLSHDARDERAPWGIDYRHLEVLERAALKRALALGFELRSHECGGGATYELSRGCFGMRAAAIKALELARLLPGVSADAWLWVTVYNWGDRGPTPDPPDPWPPAGG